VPRLEGGCGEISNLWKESKSGCGLVMKKKQTKRKEKRRGKKDKMTKVSDIDRQVQKLAIDFVANTGRTEELAKQVSEASREVESFGRELASSQELAESLTRTVETSNVKIQRLVDEIALYKTEIEKQLRSSGHKNNGVGDLTANMASTDQKVESLKSELSRVNESLFLLQSDGKDIYQRVGEHDTSISDVRARIDGLANESIPRLMNQLETFQKEFQSWSDKIFGLTETVSGLSQRLVAVSNNDNGSTIVLGEQLGIMNGRMDTLERGIAENSTRIAELQVVMTSFAKRLATVEIDTSGPSASKFDEF
jgi:chromosome segregation ATPase